MAISKSLTHSTLRASTGPRPCLGSAFAEHLSKVRSLKVVLFCGGLGTRLREYSDTIPKPMVPVGYRPVIWHIMRYYAHYGHKDFILCLGHRGD
jgi:hypothetical protein